MSNEESFTDTEVPLAANVYERLMAYQADDEDLEDTLARVFRAFVPHETYLSDARLDPESIDGKVIVEKWPDEDGCMQTHVMDSPTQAAKRYDHAIHATQAAENYDAEMESER